MMATQKPEMCSNFREKIERQHRLQEEDRERQRLGSRVFDRFLQFFEQIPMYLLEFSPMLPSIPSFIGG